MAKAPCVVLLHTYHHQPPGTEGFLAYSCDGPNSKYGLLGTMRSSWDTVAHLARLDAEYDLRLGIVEVHSCRDFDCKPCNDGAVKARYYSRKDSP